MYGPAFKELPDVTFVEWPPYKGEKSIKDISIRIIRHYNINSSDIVGGSSLGGIVASEIAKYIAIKKVILIGSTLTPESINPVLKNLSVLSEIAPTHLLKTFADRTSLLTENQLLKMFRKSDNSFVKTMFTAIFEWDGNPTPKCTIAHIHGAKDLVIYPPKTGATLIPDGRHLIAISHEKKVAEFINKNITSQCCDS